MQMTPLDVIKNFYTIGANALLRFLHRRKHFGALRFWICRWIYKMIPFYPNTKNLRWDFVLQYLPHLKLVCWKGFSVLEVGCADSLLLYEIRRRGYRAFGMDIRDYQAPLSVDKGFFEFLKYDILEDNLAQKLPSRFHYVVALSTIELVGCGLYGDKKTPNADRKALENIYDLLIDGGYFIMSVPIVHWRNMESRGYTYLDFIRLVNGLFYVCESTQLGGHICAVLVKNPNAKTR